MISVGNRIRLSGGYEPDAPWLAGKTAIMGTLEGFIPGQNDQTAAVVRLDHEIQVEGTRGSHVVLELRYVGATWKEKEVVHVELCNFVPEAKRWQDRPQGKWIESHATFTVIDDGER